MTIYYYTWLSRKLIAFMKPTTMLITSRHVMLKLKTKSHTNTKLRIVVITPRKIFPRKANFSNKIVDSKTQTLKLPKTKCTLKLFQLTKRDDISSQHCVQVGKFCILNIFFNRSMQSFS